LRTADKFDFSKRTSVEDAKYKRLLDEAKNNKDIVGVQNIVNEHNQVLADRINNSPQYFTNPDGSFDANYYSTLSRMDNNKQTAESFAETVARENASLSDKAQKEENRRILGSIDNKAAVIADQIDALKKGFKPGLDGASKLSELADLFAQKNMMDQAKYQYNQQMYQATGDVKYDTAAVKLKDDVRNSEAEAQKYMDLMNNPEGSCSATIKRPVPMTLSELPSLTPMAIL
jgi:hypothetical protein